ncbi:hypothetical protein [Mycobacterium avium]|uniref:hypothetical protein n=1 Tax=Mycobacterium avium TaxID=1764 RepID=UPI0007A0A3C4|nr:hypothetical protein [Mycobacterium avium]MDO2394722.1 hypothetical protein [Mycobacterium avium subsp. hominissuis]PBA68942.1 hypothetical protein CKJ76_25515 [Mycobacterium avium]
MVGISEDIRKPSSDGDAGEGSATGTKSDWRRRERRQAQKYFGKRLTDADHQLIKNYAQSLDLDMSDLIAPYVDKILKQARAHARQTTSARAS